MKTILSLIVATILFCFVLRTSTAGHGQCDSCGCQKQVKKICRLVVNFKDTELPTYKCIPMTVFYPAKGAICRTEHRCETVCRLHKSCDGSKSLRCKTCCDYKTQCGAMPTGCKSDVDVRQPTGSSKKTIPLVQWVTVQVCKHCFLLDRGSNNR